MQAISHNLPTDPESKSSQFKREVAITEEDFCVEGRKQCLLQTGLSECHFKTHFSSVHST